MLGATSDTDDLTGQITKAETTKPRQITKQKIQKALKQLTGTIQQIPPAFSAKKVMGERAYKLARQGIMPSLKPQTVTVHNIKLISYDYLELTLNITCSTGTYIRSLARDIGTKLGTGAYVKQLKRTRIGSHNIQDSVKLNQLNQYNLNDHLLPPEALVSHLPKVILSNSNVAQFTNGLPIGSREDTEQKTTNNSTNTQYSPPQQPMIAVFNQSSTLIGIAKLDPSTHLLHPQKVLCNRQ